MMVLSLELEAIASDFGSRQRPMQANELADTATLIMYLSQMARLMEQELHVFRSLEADGQIRETLEAAATDNLEDLVADAKGKVLRPDFGGRRS